MHYLLLPLILLSYCLPIISAEVEVKEPPKYSYDDKITNFKVRGKYGRYLRFTGKTRNQYRSYSDPGSPGQINCTNTGFSTTCRNTGYIAPTYKSGGIQWKNFLYELDCQDRTFNRMGDRSSAGGGMKGWMDIGEDPVANAVATKYCPIIHNLPMYYKENGKYFFDKFTHESHRDDAVNALYVRGKNKYQNGDLLGGMNDLTEVIKIVPNHAGALADRSLIKESMGDYKGACSDMQKANSYGYIRGEFRLKFLSESLNYPCPAKQLLY
tara:strand:+ start:477 stop:1280 length:804 start_codon:yes stop_codon:yes gene_type:complete